MYTNIDIDLFDQYKLRNHAADKKPRTFQIAETELGNFTDAAREVVRASKAERGCNAYVFSMDLHGRTTFATRENLK